MLGMNKFFVVCIFIAGVIGYGTKSWNNFFVIAAAVSIIRIIWKLLTQ